MRKHKVEFAKLRCKPFANAAMVGFGVLLATTLSAQAKNPTPILDSHRAVYELQLDTSTPSLSVSALSGRMVYEFIGSSCTDYKQKIRFVTRTKDKQGRETVLDLRTFFEEDGAGQEFKFKTDHIEQNRKPVVMRGAANRTVSAGKATVTVTANSPKPIRKTYDKDVLFPIQHTIGLLQAAQKGETIYSKDVFDGSDEKMQSYATTAIIGTAKPPGAHEGLPKSADTLKKLKAWPVALSYYTNAGHAKQDATPSYEVGFMFYENGVSDRLLLNYGSFAIKGKLSKLTLLDTPACKTKSREKHIP